MSSTELELVYSGRKASHRRKHGRLHTVLHECDLGGAVDGDESVLVRLLRVLVHQTAGEDGHLVAVKNRHVGERPGLDVVATVLREEDRDVCVGELLNERTVAGLLEGGVSAPFLLFC